MTDFWVSDLSIFYGANTPGCVQVTFGSTTIWVQWFNEYEGALLFGGEIESKHPYLMARDSDISGITHSSTFVKDSVTYKVVKVSPGDSGETVIELSKD